MRFFIAFGVAVAICVLYVWIVGEGWPVRRGCGTPCQREGLCTESGDGCVAASRDDCTPSYACVWEGRCEAADGVCVATSDLDCMVSRTCKRDGRCSVGEGECVATRDQDCQATRACELDGYCWARGGNCLRERDPNRRPTPTEAEWETDHEVPWPLRRPVD